MQVNTLSPCHDFQFGNKQLKYSNTTLYELETVTKGTDVKGPWGLDGAD